MVSSTNLLGYNPNLALGKTKGLRSVKANQQDVKKLLNYVGDVDMSSVPDTFTSNAKSSANSALMFEGLPALAFLKNSKKTTGHFINSEMAELGKANKTALQNLLHGKGKFTQRLSNFVTVANDSNAAYSGIKSVTKLDAKAAKAANKALKYKGATSAFGKAKYNKAFNKAIKFAAKADEQVAANAAAKTAAKTTGKIAGKFGKFGKAMKSSGAGIMLAFSGISELATEVVPTFKEVGKEEGMKQLGKSSLKVVGDTVGFIAGQKAGVALGTAIGSAICPGIGTAVGAVVGFLGGMLGSWVAGKATSAINGKTEREKAAEKQAQQDVKNISNDPNALQDIKDATMYKLQEEAAMNNGQLSQESMEVYQALQNLNNTNPYMVA